MFSDKEMQGLPRGTMVRFGSHNAVIDGINKKDKNLYDITMKSGPYAGHQTTARRDLVQKIY